MNKFLVFSALAVLVCAFTDPTNADEAAANTAFQNAADKCKTEQNVSENDAKILQNINQAPANEAQSCYIECVAKEIGYIKDGKLNKENFITFNKNRFNNDPAKVAEAEALFTKCQPEVESKASEKCGAGKAMRACVINFFKLN